MDGYGLRSVRAVVFAALSVLLSAGARLVVTGQPLPLDLVLIGFAGSLGAAMLLIAAERGFWCIAAVLVPLQMGLNALFNAGQQSCPPGTGTGGAVTGWPGMLACGGGSIRPGLLGIATQAPRVLVSVTGREVLLLLLLHLLLALATAWWLRRGEAALFTVLRSLAVAAWPTIAALLVWLTTPQTLPQTPCWLLPPTDKPHHGPQDALLSAASRRGPPVLAPAC
ncbi:hypothetical protein [Streptacidiphilus sp. EB129]|uniref:hypothetical protein n=1 Tax=Streptacidiphilus sp. EB129 TaxID=3156262 RepID=UPI003519B259